MNNLVEYDSEFRDLLKKRVDYSMAYGNGKHETMSEQMVANDIGISYTTLRKVLRDKNKHTITREKYNQINEWMSKNKNA
ncbi:hypothetical protein JOC36_000822 [Weissella uvarum]|uniref:hypothetical protein n=1 Tax=Bacilli TaxID=91061 RepID=UPI00196030CA|nr:MULTISPECIES: hypothetical protein [Bacilli]MBM7617273.1 hypothetical protein [Weissella uvarum]MCM0595223.1 hypothetical protein [Weissella uvarum]MDA5653794.1 hypothetical protein [Staphylococcus aureus]